MLGIFFKINSYEYCSHIYFCLTSFETYRNVDRKIVCVLEVGGGRCQNLKNGRKPVKIQRKVRQDALGKVNRIKEIGGRE